MIIKSIKLTDFRSYQEREFRFPRGTTLVVGPNRSGKTNLLEAIYLLATGRSFRAGVEAEMIRYGEEIARVGALVAQRHEVTDFSFGVGARDALLTHESNNFKSPPTSRRGGSAQIRSQGSLHPHPFEKTSLEIILTTGQVAGKRAAKKRYLVNGVGRRRMDFVGQLRGVLFGPEDLEIILGSPSIRRNYLDSVLEQVDREYRRANLSYQKGLRQRNKTLERIRELEISELENARKQLYFWNNLLIKNGEVITQKRGELIDFINQQPEYFGRLRVKYDKSLITPQRLEKYAEQEVAAGMTLVGPHRDELRIVIRDTKNARRERDLSIYGSRGEQRTAVLSLKLAEMEFVTEKTGSRPVLLLDDIFSELDQEHRERVFEVIPRQQTIITTTDIRLVAPLYRKKVEIVELG